MKGALVFLVLLAFVVYLRLAHWKTGTGEFLAFGESVRPKDGNPADDAAARAALDGWLREKGYRPPEPFPSGPARLEYAPPRHLLRVPVVVTPHPGGFDVTVSWAKEGLAWTVDQRETRARNLAAELAAWWAEYRKAHPKP